MPGPPEPKRSRFSSPEQKTSSSNVLVSSDYRSWTVEDVYKFVCSKDMGEEEAKCLKEANISGETLICLSDDEMERIGIESDARLKLRDIIEELHSKRYYKIFNDSIHGTIEVHPLCVNIMDTVEFQRLRQIKQLGCCYLVYPGASHNRFEHSIGVSYLAGELARSLRERQPELKITDKEILCVEIAGLCHDLGHGPFSHVFDALFMPRVDPDSKWTHEEGSLRMFDHLVDKYELEAKFDEYKLDTKDIIFIKEQFNGPLIKDGCQQYSRPNRRFLYEIVSNKRNGIDVDKWDYFARDCHMLGISNSFDHNRFMKFAKVIRVDGEYQICMRDTEVENLYDMFYTRNSLHKRAYQHKVNKIMEKMIVEALVLANDHHLIPGENGNVKMSEAISDMTAYANMTDNIIYELLRSSDPNLAKSREIITDVLSRRLYKYIGQTSPNIPIPKKEIAKIADEILECQPKTEKTKLDLVILPVSFNYGMKSKNPIEFVRFYAKEDPHNARKLEKEEVSRMLPEHFSEQQIRVYCTKRDEVTVDNATRYFKEWHTTKWKKRCNNAVEMTPEHQPTSGARPHASGTAKKELTF